MSTMSYYSGGRAVRISFGDLKPTNIRYGGSTKGSIASSEKRSSLEEIQSVVQRSRLREYFNDHSKGYLVSTTGAGVQLIPTETIALDGARSADLAWLRKKFGTVQIDEGLHGKALVRVPESGRSGVVLAFELSRETIERGRTEAAHPNFVRMSNHPSRPGARTQYQWNLDNVGKQGISGADVHAHAAWTISEGSRSISVAVLDEGIDSKHTFLKHAIMKEADFIETNSHGRPNGNDAHGTACAGIIASKGGSVRGLAPSAGLISARVAIGHPSMNAWIWDDFGTADAVDWSWDAAGASVLSNSWGGGPPADVISRAILRARRFGRNKRGCVVVFAAGNEQRPIGFPGDITGVLTVGASNQWDERKTRKSKDKESWWGSNYGPNLGLMAPGVRIATTDISGNRGYGRKNVVENFNGTSSAAPHVAAAAALILSVEPRLNEREVRDILTETADKICDCGGHNNLVGHGRLNVYAALRRTKQVRR